MNKNLTKYRNYIFDFKGATVMLLTFISVVSIIGLVVKYSKVFFHYNLENLEGINIFLYLLTVLPLIISFDYFLMRKNGKKLNFNMQSRPFHVYLLIFPMMFGMMMISEYITELIPTTGLIFGNLYKFYTQALTEITKDNVETIITVVIFAPVLEEILFRGIIQKGLINKGVKPINAIIISALTFGIFHGNPWQFVGASLLGLVLGLVYFKTKSLLMSIFLHAFNNGISAYLLIKMKTESFSDFFHVSEFVILLIGISVFSLFYYLFMFKNKVYYRE